MRCISTRSTQAFTGSNSTGCGLHPGLVVTCLTQGALCVETHHLEASLTTCVSAGCDKHPVRWLTVEEIRKQQRMRRETVVAAMLAGVLPYEQRGRIRYARVSDVEAWEKSRLENKLNSNPRRMLIRPDLAEFT